MLKNQKFNGKSYLSKRVFITPSCYMYTKEFQAVNLISWIVKLQRSKFDHFQFFSFLFFFSRHAQNAVTWEKRENREERKILENKDKVVVPQVGRSLPCFYYIFHFYKKKPMNFMNLQNSPPFFLYLHISLTLFLNTFCQVVAQISAMPSLDNA